MTTILQKGNDDNDKDKHGFLADGWVAFANDNDSYLMYINL
jgi:hypothetical protein